MTERRVHPAVETGYSDAAGVYAEARPSFPPGAVDWLLSELGVSASDEVVEVGAGTGKFTALLVERGIRVAAVEPVAEMRAKLAELGETVRAIDATAEDLPFEAASVPAVIASQSLHWTDVERALAEFDRVLAPEGGGGLIWNFRGIDVPWQRDLDCLLGELRGSAPHSRDGRWQRAVAGSGFVVAANASWTWSLATNVDGILKRVRSVSYVAALPEAARRGVDDDVRAILARHDLASGDVSFGYVTEAYVLRRPS